MAFNSSYQDPCLLQDIVLRLMARSVQLGHLHICPAGIVMKFREEIRIVERWPKHSVYCATYDDKCNTLRAIAESQSWSLSYYEVAACRICVQKHRNKTLYDDCCTPRKLFNFSVVGIASFLRPSTFLWQGITPSIPPCMLSRTPEFTFSCFKLVHRNSIR